MCEDGLMAAAGEPTTRASILLALRDPADAAAWEAFFARYEPLIRRWVRGKTRAGDEDAVTQDVLVKLFLKLPEYEHDPSKRFRGWLRRLVQNEVHDYWRRQVRRPGDHGDGGTTNQAVLGAIPDVGVREAEAQLLHAEDLLEYERLLRAAISRVRPRLKEPRWQAFHLTTAEGRRGIDVAAELGMTVGAVYVAKNHVTKLIRAEVERVREEEGRLSGPIRTGPSRGNDHDDA